VLYELVKHHDFRHSAWVWLRRLDIPLIYAPNSFGHETNERTATLRQASRRGHWATFQSSRTIEKSLGAKDLGFFLWLTLVDDLRNDFEQTTEVDISRSCSVSTLASLLPPV
jgi:hypothetical protein